MLLEKNENVLDGASKGNSGLLHTGFDAEPKTLEAKCVIIRISSEMLTIFTQPVASRISFSVSGVQAIQSAS